jgi:hypothetical protein
MFLSIHFLFQKEGKLFHDFQCFNQTCDGQESGLCGSSKMRAIFGNILSVMGNRRVEFFEHVEVTYTRSDLKKVNLTKS